MSLRPVLLFLFAALVLSCSSTTAKKAKVPGVLSSIDTDDTALVCVDLPENLVPLAMEAVEMWDHSIEKWKRLKPIRGDEWRCSFWIHETTETLESKPEALAWASRIGGREIFMKVGRYEQDVKGIVLHELGHALGAQHVENTLMNEHWAQGRFVCPDVVTVAQIAAFHNVNLETLSWCKR